MGDDPSVPDELPGEDFPPERPLGVRPGAYADDGSVAEDDVATREARLEPEQGFGSGSGGLDLVGDPTSPSTSNPSCWASWRTTRWAPTRRPRWPPCTSSRTRRDGGA